MIKLVAIGYMGDMTVYINLSKTEAVRRYNVENNEVIDENSPNIIELEVEDSFSVYDIWKE